jgi:hypothetical protein
MGAGLIVRLLNGSRVLYSSTLLLLSFLAGILFINIFPGFISDDYYIYRVVKGTAAPVCTNPEEIFFLFLRPVSWFSFYIDQNVFSGFSYPAKLFSLSLHLVLIYILYQLCCLVQGFAGKDKIDYTAVVLAVLIFTVHPDVVMYLAYLNNRTELLMILFYAASVLVFLKYCNKTISKYTFILLAPALYTLSILSKQTGIHLPLLFLLALFLLDINKEMRKVIIIVSIIMIMIAVFFSYINYTLIDIDSAILSSFWKKPFAMAGTFLFVTVPFAAEDIYSYFIMNKVSAVVIAFVLSFVLSFYAIKKRFIKQAVIASLFIIILFYPRILHTGGGRINTHLLLCMSMIIVLLAGSSGWIKGIIAIYIIVLFSYSVTMLAQTEKYESTRRNILTDLHRYTLEVHPKKVFVALADHAAFLDEYFYYQEYNLQNSINDGTPLVSKFLFQGNIRKELVVNYSAQNDKIIFSSCKDDVFIGDSPMNRIKKTFTTQPVGNNNREYYSYSLSLPDSINKLCAVVYFNGLNWQGVN